jgi:hypothetical protein
MFVFMYRININLHRFEGNSEQKFEYSLYSTYLDMTGNKDSSVRKKNNFFIITWKNKTIGRKQYKHTVQKCQISFVFKKTNITHGRYVFRVHTLLHLYTLTYCCVTQCVWILWRRTNFAEPKTSTKKEITWITPKVKMSKDKIVANKNVTWCACLGRVWESEELTHPPTQPTPTPHPHPYISIIVTFFNIQ